MPVGYAYSMGDKTIRTMGSPIWIYFDITNYLRHIYFSVLLNPGRYIGFLYTPCRRVGRGEFRPRQTRQLPRAVDLKERLLSCQSY